MSVGSWWVLFGGVGQLVGVGVTAMGALETWNRFRPAEAIQAPLVNRLARDRHRVLARLRAILGRRPKTQYVSGVGVTGSLSAVSRARGRTGYRDLSPDLEPSDALAELDQRTRELMKTVQDCDEKHSDETNRLANEIERLRADVESGLSIQEMRTADAATGSVQLLLFGLSITALGVIAQTVGSLLP